MKTIYYILGRILFYSIFIVILILPTMAFAESVQVALELIVASNKVPGIDERIEHRLGQLQSVFAFQGYQLQEEYPLTLMQDSVQVLALDNKRTLTICLTKREAHTVTVNIKITNQAGFKLLDTDVQLAFKSTLLLGGIRLQEGVLIIAITAES